MVVCILVDAVEVIDEADVEMAAIAEGKDAPNNEMREKMAQAAEKRRSLSFDAQHEKTDFKVYVVVVPKEGWAHVAAPILLLV